MGWTFSYFLFFEKTPLYAYGLYSELVKKINAQWTHLNDSRKLRVFQGTKGLNERNARDDGNDGRQLRG